MSHINLTGLFVFRELIFQPDKWDILFRKHYVPKNKVLISSDYRVESWIFKTTSAVAPIYTEIPRKGEEWWQGLSWGPLINGGEEFSQTQFLENTFRAGEDAVLMLLPSQVLWAPSLSLPVNEKELLDVNLIIKVKTVLFKKKNVLNEK